ncbi:juvenile hormone acid O-methyltransferase-like [Schistocerca serialis cubense]|uniref:juvenile hormone acid O-methyltransferase-like n=1 Tax=Schistocerca serialis cubense TaxID=2023355 RepID=UPI00214E6053|nr:juvenile hormone acid O-methyltransferase-like [Schistocerca serialis cubense]
MNDADLYAESSSLQQQFVNKVLRELWPALDWRCEQGTVLDVGCGAGDVTTYELLPRLPPGVSVHAVDISPAMVAKAADRFSGPRLCFRQLDIGTPHIEETDVWRLGPLPKVFSFFCLHWVQDQRIPQQQREAFIQDCVAEAYSNGTIRADTLPGGTVYSFPYSAMFAHAVKV